MDSNKYRRWKMGSARATPAGQVPRRFTANGSALTVAAFDPAFGRRSTNGPAGGPAPRIICGGTVLAIILLWVSNSAYADCAAGDGNIAAPVTCTTPQILTGSTGTIVSGATLMTAPNTTAYTMSSNNAAVTNAGTVASQGSQAFFVNSNGSTLTNDGTITASQGTAIVVSQSGSLNIMNTGNIVGGNGTAIQYTPNPGAPVGEGLITQAAGTITGNIQLSGLDTTLRVTGGAIVGSIIDSTPASGAAGSSDGRGGIVNFDLGSGSFATNGPISVATVNIQSGTLVLQHDVYVSGGARGPGLTNSATLQINGQRSLTGAFVQNPGGTLIMQVSPTESSKLTISHTPFRFIGGTARLAGTLALAYQPGTYQPRSYTLLSAADGVTGTFSNIAGGVPTTGLTQTVAIGPRDVQLTLTGGAGSAIEVAPTNASVLPAMATSVVLTGQWMTGILLDRLGTRQGGIADGAATAGAALGGPMRIAQNGNIAALGEIASALPQTPTAEGVWFRGIGDLVSLRGSATVPGFNGSSGGFLAGYDRPITPNLSLGLAAGYVHSDVSEGSATSGRTDSVRGAVYGGGWVGPNLFTGTAGYAYDPISTARSVAGIGTARESHDGHEFSIAGQWALPMRVPGLADTAVVTPKFGLQFLHFIEDGYKESGADGFNLSSGGTNTDSLQPYIGFAAAEKFVTVDGAEITPEIRLGYSREVLSNARLITVASADGTPFVVSGVKPSRDMLTAGIGATLRAQNNIFLYANYDALVPVGNTTQHTVSAGLRIHF